jgi:hypothetical protein
MIFCRTSNSENQARILGNKMLRFTQLNKQFPKTSRVSRKHQLLSNTPAPISDICLSSTWNFSCRGNFYAHLPPPPYLSGNEQPKRLPRGHSFPQWRRYTLFTTFFRHNPPESWRNRTAVLPVRHSFTL